MAASSTPAHATPVPRRIPACCAQGALNAGLAAGHACGSDAARHGWCFRCFEVLSQFAFTGIRVMATS